MSLVAGKRLVLALTISMLAASCSPAVDIQDSVARIEATACNRATVGSAFAVETDLLMTNAHVLAGVESDIGVVTPDGEIHTGVVEAFDPLLDIALVRVAGLDAVPVTFAASIVGDVGFIGAVVKDGVVTPVSHTVLRHIVANSGDIYDQGVVSRPAVELRAAIDPGTSGAAVFDELGRVIGLAFAENRNDDITYAIGQELLADFLAEPRASSDTGRCRR
ncbi:MAG: trypsin-like peptidase domain-containing protein [Acidimicrobiia bacterium]|nr:trypsin-like peptidase domain-containing protein [Acidimicrobiia bacterium]